MQRIIASIIMLTVVLTSSCSGGLDDIDDNLTVEKQHITIFFGCSDTDLGVQDLITTLVEERFPSVQLEWEIVGWDEYFSQQLDAKIASGELPDIIIGKEQDVNKYEKIGILGQFPEDDYDIISEKVIDNALIEDKLYGIPYNQFYQGVIYNKNIFWRYGIEPPDNIEKMREIVDKLNEVEIVPFATHFYDYWYTGNILMQFQSNNEFRKNANWGYNLKHGKISIYTSDEFKNSAYEVKYVYDNSWEDVSNVGQSECINRFINEESAMFLTGSWSIQDIYSIYPEMQLGIFPYPNYNGTQKLLYEPNLTFMKNKKTEYKQLVDEIIKTIVNDNELREDICAFTQTSSTAKGINTNNIKFISKEIDNYINNNNITDVNIANNQIVWSFQLEQAKIIKSWLDGKSNFEDVLAFIDKNISHSY